jgi:hypothetical protein
LTIENKISYDQVVWWFKRLRSKKQSFKSTFHDFTFEEEEYLEFYFNYSSKKPCKKKIQELATSIRREETLVANWFLFKNSTTK